MGLSNDITEEDIEEVMSRFGKIEKVKIPMEELRNGSRRKR
jgi:RNA recognition motif-containing protein